MAEFGTVRVAAIQATPVILDADASVEKAIRLVGDAAADGAQLAVLPEAFVPLYPSEHGPGAAAFGGFDELWERLWANSVDVPGPLVDELTRACAEHDIVLQSASTAGVRASGLALQHDAPDRPRRADGKRRKLMPTHHERLFHGIGAGDDLDAVETPLGRIGA